MTSIVDKINSKYAQLVSKYGERKIRYISFFVSFILSSFLLLLGTSNGHDLAFHISRIQGIVDGLKAGTFPVLIYPKYVNGYGYANGIFYPDLFLYFPAILVYLFYIPVDLSYSIFLMLVNLAGILIVYFSIKKITSNELISLIMARVFILSPYYLCNLYSRSAVGELIGLIFLPLLILGLYEIVFGDYKKGYYFTIAIALTASSHLLSLIFCFLITIIFFIINLKIFFKEKNRFKYLLLYGILSIALSCYVILPIGDMMISGHYVYQNDINSIRRMNYIYDCFIEMPFDKHTSTGEFAGPGIGLSFLYLFVIYLKNEKENKNRKFELIMLISGFIFLIMTSNIFPWKYFHLLDIIQFAFRFYGVATTCLVFAFAIALSDIKSSNIGFHSFMLFLINSYTIICLLMNNFYFSYYNIGFKRDVHYSVGLKEYLPVIVDYDFLVENDNYSYSNNNINYSITKNGTNLVVNYSGNYYDDTYIEVPLIYYKGYIAEENNADLPIKDGDYGLIRIYLINEQGTINVYYGFTLSRKVGYAITLFALLFMALGYNFNNKNANMLPQKANKGTRFNKI